MYYRKLSGNYRRIIRHSLKIQTALHGRLINFSSLRNPKNTGGQGPPATASGWRCSVRERSVWDDIDAAGLQRAVRLPGRVDADVGAGLELVLVAGDIFPDHGVWPDDDLLLAVLVLHHDVLTINAGYRGVDRGVGHGGVRAGPRPVPFAGAAHRLGKDDHTDRLLAAIGLRRRADADERAFGDVRHRRLGKAPHDHVVGQRHLLLASLRLDDEKIAINTLDLPDHGHDLRLLRRSRRNRERRNDGRSSKNACDVHVIPPLWNGPRLDDTPDPTPSERPPDVSGGPTTRICVTPQPLQLRMADRRPCRR